jgi:hypothetical protein
VSYLQLTAYLVSVSEAELRHLRFITSLMQAASGVKSDHDAGLDSSYRFMAHNSADSLMKAMTYCRV